MSLSSQIDDDAAALRNGVEPDWAARDAKHWAMVVDRLVQESQFDAAERTVGRLSPLHPAIGVFSRLSLLLRTTPPASGDAVYDAFRDDAEADVQVARRRGASEVLLAFTGVGGRIGMPLPLAHRWFGALNVHVVYLRDFARQAYNDGVRSLGPTYEAGLEGLWRLADALNARTILTFGNSAGGYGALRYGLDLRARSMLVFGAPTSLTPPVSPVEEVRRRGLRLSLDLKPFFMAADPPPRATLVYEAQHEVDVRQAEHLAGVPGVSLRALAGCGRHDSMLRAVELSCFGDLLQGLVGS